MARSYTNLLYHIVFGTKDRRPWLAGEIGPRVHRYLGGGIRAEGGIALAVNGMPDHVHVLAKLKQDKAVADVVRDLKAISSRWLHKTFPELRGFAWQGGYAAFTVSTSKVEDVERYIRNQETHHRKRTFEEEIVALLEAHRVEFDRRYLWG